MQLPTFDQDTSHPFRDAALFWYNLGFAVIPIAKGSKTPPFAYKDAQTRDLKTINIWRQTHGDLGIAIMPGRTGHIVLDIDNKGGSDKLGTPKPNGFEALAELELTLSSLPRTLALVSGSGKGAHYVFSGGHVGMHRLQWHPGLDLMAGPQAILVVAPTVHPSGGRYSIKEMAPVARIPADWAESIGDNTVLGKRLGPGLVAEYHDDVATVRRCARWLKTRDGAVEGRGGDHYTFSTICILRDKGLSPDVAFRLLTKWNERCEPPWDEGALRGKVDNAYQYAKNDVGVDHPANEFQDLVEAATPATEAEVIAISDDIDLPSVVEPDPGEYLLTKNPLPTGLPPLEVVRAVIKNGQCYEGKDKLKPTPLTLRAIFDHDPVWKGVLCRNVRTAGKEYTRTPEFPVVDLNAFNDLDILSVQRYIWDRWGTLFDKAELRDALDLGISQNPKDHVRDYVLGLPKWDGVERVATFFEKYLGADGLPWQEEAARVWFCGSVQRALFPGSKFDHMLILQGAQGLGKSSALAALYDGARGGYSDAVIDFGQAPQSWVPTICAAWCHEAGEMVGMSSADANKIKHVITTRHHTVTLKYDRNASVLPVGYVLAATTNEKNVLRDPTGTRRFIVIKTYAADIPAIRADREQIWAEARHLLMNGQRVWLADEAKKDSEKHNEGLATFVDHPWYELVSRLADGTKTLVPDIMRGNDAWMAAKREPGSEGCEKKILASRLYSALDIDGIRGNMGHTAALRGILAALGYDPCQRKVRVGDELGNGWYRV